MSLPGDLTTITVTSSYPNVTGLPQSGSVVFDPQQPITDATGKVIIEVPATTNVFNGVMQPVVLPCTDNANFNPSSFQYKITETIGSYSRVWYTSLPHTLGATVDLSSLSPASAAPSSSAFASNNTWTGTNTFQGETVVQTPVNSGDAATKAYVDTSVSPMLPKAGGTMTGELSPAVVSLTFGASIAVNAAVGNVFALTLTASTGTLANPTNPVEGQTIRVRVVQDGTGSRTLAFGTAYDFGAVGAPTLSTGANKVDILGFEYVASLSKWCYLGSGLGF